MLQEKFNIRNLWNQVYNLLSRYTENIGINLAYLYVMLPAAIFLLEWTRWYIAAISVLVLIFCYVSLCRYTPILWKPRWSRKSIEKIILITGIVFLWVYLSGIGGFVFQNTDHNCRNAIFESLVHNPWPVTKTFNIDGVQSQRGLIYYIGFWLPSAMVGKIFGLQAGYCFQALWAVIGILLFYYLICAIRKKLAIWPLIIFIFFSGLDIIGYYLTRSDFSDFTNILHIEWWSGFQFSSFTTQLFWVFNQALPAWIITLLLYLQKSNRFIILLLGISMLTSTLPFIGLLPFALTFMATRNYKISGLPKRFIMFIKDTLSFENIMGGGFVGILSFAYLRGNISANNLGGITKTGGMRGYLLLYIIFILLEAGVYFISIYKYQKKNYLFYIIILWLCICPFITVGFGKDFCMRASIPALVLLFLLVIDTLEKSKKLRDYWVLASLMVLLLLGSITSLHEITRTIAETAGRYRNGTPVMDENITEENLLKGRNFSGEVEGNFFYKYIGK